MAEASIPVDLFNPGQVFACLGFLEATDVLLSNAECSFDWTDSANVRFLLRASGEENPFAVVLEFLATAKPQRWGPVGYTDPPLKKGKAGGQANDEDDTEDESVTHPADGSEGKVSELKLSDTFFAPEGNRMSLPIRLGGGNQPTVELGHWADGSSRDSFKLYAGNRSADRIARAMLLGVRKKLKKGQLKKGQLIGDLKTKGVAQLWDEQRETLIEHPFHVLTPMGGSFNFDPRGAWTAIDAGYSPNDQKHQIEASPVVEFLAAWGLENARPQEFETRMFLYAAWGAPLPLMLARATLCGNISVVPLQRFRFELDMSGKNKVVTFAEPENQ
jgi:CRISPR-associated protein Csx14